MGIMGKIPWLSECAGRCVHIVNSVFAMLKILGILFDLVFEDRGFSVSLWLS